MKNRFYYDAYHRQKRFPRIASVSLFRGKTGIFLLSFFIAILICRILLWEDMQSIARWSRTCIERMGASAVDQKEMLWYVLIRRLELLSLLILCGITKIRKILYYLCSAVVGSAFGIFLLSMIQSFGVSGVILAISVLMPQWFIYGILYVYLYWLFVRRVELRGYEEMNASKPFQIGMLLLYILGILGLLASGIYLECYVNPLLVAWVKGFL